MIREATASDREAVIALITRVYETYGERICLENADADLCSIPQSYRERDGRFIVLLHNDEVIGCHAAHPIDATVCTFRRLYLSPDHRRQGHGRRLMDWAVAWAREQQFQRVEFWSDTRFREAHEFFRRYGFQTEGETREMDDGWEPYQEFFFWLDLSS